MKAFVFSFSILMAAAMANCTGAAEFSHRVLDHPPDARAYEIPHRITLQGEIREGDLERLQALIAEHGLGSVRNRRLRLDSPGGSYAEGLRIADFVHRFMPTYLGPGDECFSSCALIFMSGASPEGDGYFERDRLMHPQASLGFHAPFAFGTGQPVDPAVAALIASEAERGAHLAASKLVRMSVDGRMPPSLVEELLQVDSAQLLLVDTVDRAARWDIRLEHARVFGELDHDRAATFCDNESYWVRDVAFEDRDGGGAPALMPTEDPPGFWGDGLDFSCKLELYVSPRDGPIMQYSDQFRARQVPVWQTYPANTKLAALGPDAIEGAAPRPAAAPQDRPVQPIVGRCVNRNYWSAGPDTSDGGGAYARYGDCGGGFGPFAMSCKPGEGRLSLRISLNRDGESAGRPIRLVADIDGQGFELSGVNGHVYGNQQAYVSLAPSHPLVEALQAGSTLRFPGEGPDGPIHLTDSRKTISEMLRGCGYR